jgi:hypothetical protein
MSKKCPCHQFVVRIEEKNRGAQKMTVYSRNGSLSKFWQNTLFEGAEVPDIAAFNLDESHHMDFLATKPKRFFTRWLEFSVPMRNPRKLHTSATDPHSTLQCP